MVLASTRLRVPDFQAEIAEVNGQPATILRASHKAVVIIAIEIHSGYVQEIRVIGNPDKLRWV